MRFYSILIFCCSLLFVFTKKPDVLVYTVATEGTDGFFRYLDSAKQYDINPQILGWDQKWKGGDMNKPGGGWKVNLLKEALQSHRNDKDKIVLFTDGYDVLFLGTADNIINRFKAKNASILFGAEQFCWPNVELAPQYPQVESGKRFLNSGMYIGQIHNILSLLEKEKIADTDDDQLFFTRAYLDQNFRESNQFKLDYNSDIFQNINGASNELEIITENKEAEIETYGVKNVISNTEPLVLHGNGPAKITLNQLSNYLPNGVWNSKDGCIKCKRNTIVIDDIKNEDLPIVFIAIFVELNTPFFPEHLEKILALKYPKNRIHLFIHNTEKYHSRHVKKFVDKHASEYLSVKKIMPEDGTSEGAARELSLSQCLLKKCDYYFSIDSVAHIDNPNTLHLLIAQNRTVVAPLLVRPGKAWSNFWGALSKEGYYARSNDYMQIVHNEKRGLWNVPFINGAYLVNGTLLRRFDLSKISFMRPNMDSDMSFCASLRELDIFMYVSNRVDFGHLVNPETYDISQAEPDMYQIFENEKDWEDKFIHPDYQENFKTNKKAKQPCPDVYWFPIVSEKFATALINMMENYGKWSSGKHDDDRLEGGYEAVPTRDIHMNQVDWERHWLYFLQKYVRPLQELVFLGYVHDPPRSLMNFVVRYRPDEQPFLKPHHDSSTYTINIALNQVGVDYTGGGCRFIRYNCSVTGTKLGWMLMHPGKLTHYHEGLKVTNGTRYIMIAFVDP